MIGVEILCIGVFGCLAIEVSSIAVPYSLRTAARTRRKLGSQSPFVNFSDPPNVVSVRKAEDYMYFQLLLQILDISSGKTLVHSSALYI